MYAISFNASVAARPALSITLRHDPTVERHTCTRTRPGRDGTDIDHHSPDTRRFPIPPFNDGRMDASQPTRDELKTKVGYQKEA